MTEPIVWTVEAGAWLILFALFVGLGFRFRTLRAEYDLLDAPGVIDTDQAATLRGDVARWRAAARALRTENLDLRAALRLALDELSVLGRENELLGDVATEALAELDTGTTHVRLIPVMGRIS